MLIVRVWILSLPELSELCNIVGIMTETKSKSEVCYMMAKTLTTSASIDKFIWMWYILLNKAGASYVCTDSMSYVM